MPDQEKGSMLVSVTTLRGTFPIEGAVVTVFTGDYKEGEEIAKYITDQSGRTEKIMLDAKNKILSETAGNGIPYNTYNIYTSADGYGGQFNMNIPVFSGVTSLQDVDLVPLSALGEDASPKVVEETPKFTL